MLPHPLTSFELQKYHQNEPRFKSAYSRDNLPKHSSGECSSVEIEDGAYVINLDECSDTETHWVALYVQNNDVTYCDSFGVEHIPKEIRILMGNESIKKKFRIQEHDSTMCGYFCFGFIDFMFVGKTLTDFTNLFSPNNF